MHSGSGGVPFPEANAQKRQAIANGVNTAANPISDHLGIGTRIDRAALPRAQRSLFLVVGLLCVGAGLLGYVVPGLPGTVFLIAALWCFKRSSERFELWLLHHPLVGPTLRNWERDRCISPRTKVVAVATLWICIAVSCYLLRTPWVAALLVVTAAAVTAYLVTRKSFPTALPTVD